MLSHQHTEIPAHSDQAKHECDPSVPEQLPCGHIYLGTETATDPALSAPSQAGGMKVASHASLWWRASPRALGSDHLLSTLGTTHPMTLGTWVSQAGAQGG
jgi:hypothetical protein